MASTLFRFIAAVGRDMTVALTFGSFALAILFVMSGFVLSKGIIMDTKQINNHIVCLSMLYTKSCPLFSLLYAHRQYKKMVDMGLLDITYDVWTKCHGK
jgi:hypothetical protein